MAIQVKTPGGNVDALIAEWEAKAKVDGAEYVTRLNAHDPDAMFYLGSSYAHGRLATQLRRAVYGLSADENLSKEMIECLKRGDTQEQMMQRLLPMLLAVEETSAPR